MSNQTLTFPQIRAKCSKIPLPDIAKSLDTGLKQQFENAFVEVVDCPDLTKSPFNLTAPGLCGNYSYVADVGGPPYLVPMVNRSKIYTFENVLSNLKAPKENLPKNALVIGASAGPFRDVGSNCELVPNAYFRRHGEEWQLVENNTHYAKIVPGHGLGYELSKSPSTEFGLLGNLFISEGRPGKVLQIRASIRKGEQNFITAIRDILRESFPSSSGSEKTCISLGGVFVIQTGNAKLHIMPDFSKTPLNSDEDVNGWLRFFEMNSPLTCCTVLHSEDPGLDLRIEHTHCFSEHGQGGHYHYDTTPELVSYLAYLNVADEIVRIDPPQETHQIGRD